MVSRTASSTHWSWLSVVFCEWRGHTSQCHRGVWQQKRAANRFKCYCTSPLMLAGLNCRKHSSHLLPNALALAEAHAMLVESVRGSAIVGDPWSPSLHSGHSFGYSTRNNPRSCFSLSIAPWLAKSSAHVDESLLSLVTWNLSFKYNVMSIKLLACNTYGYDIRFLREILNIGRWLFPFNQ